MLIMEYETLLRDVRVVDGTGGAPFAADVAISDGRIAAVGRLDSSTAETVIEGYGHILAPGFIDVHTHDDTSVIHNPEMLPKLSQGVTTVVVGNCGISASPVTLPGDVPEPMNLLGDAGAFRFPRFGDYAEAVRAAGPAVNVAPLIGHTALRATHMDALDRPAGPSEIEAMCDALRAALAEGAIGLSSGLAYGNARSAPTEEVEALVSEVGAAGGIYTTHLRDEFAGLPDALHEAFDTARGGNAELVVSHLKCAGVANWGGSERALQLLDEAAERQDVGCDCYPYVASSSLLDLGQVTDEIDILITWSEPYPDQSKRWLADIARDWSVNQKTAARSLQPAGAVYYCMSEDDVQRILSHRLAMVGSDGLPNDPHPHPRLWGTFPRVLARYSRDLGLFSLATAIHKMTGLPATRFGLGDRGVIREGAWADLTLFDLERLDDVADYAQPVAQPRGIDLVMVNGEIGYQNESAAGVHGGQLLQREYIQSSIPA